MEKIKLPIILATVYLFIYMITATIPGQERWVVFLFSLSPLPVIWMVWRVLREGIASPFTFEERFYEDYEYERVKVTSMEELNS
ncbi:MAG: hypothetical protein LAT76_03700 [Schleiferiaceae bacterium]|nr:hypothetical protein [Schleiferiaceae bacterium]